MGLFTIQENRIICGRCNTEFDLNKNLEGCPLCGFGKKAAKEPEEARALTTKAKEEGLIEFLHIPPSLKLTSGTITKDEETETWGSWLMFNDFFAPKFLARVLAWKMHMAKTDSILLSDLMESSINIISKYNLSTLKGFPNLEKDKEGNRLVNHFLWTFVNMGLIQAKAVDKNIDDVWKESWDKIKVSLTKEGLEFAQIRNAVFDDEETEQILTQDEKNWLVNHLKQIDKEGYREYSVLREVYNFLKAGKNGNKDLWNWFENNEKFKKYILSRSERARKDERVYRKQIHNYARSFASAKVSLLRELGVVKDKRNDYSIIGEF
ncbi:hypothetical protein HYV85_04560 [Candidatus Woesearchaeota archaeon]|nr:hypothetical protein [Candidatus Woesearchaeota archaeon]